MPSSDFPMSLSLEEAQQRVVSICKFRQLAIDTIPLQVAVGRVLAEDAHASDDIPAFDNSAMDGFAVRGEDLPCEGEARFQVMETLLAGHVTQRVLGVGQCMRIMTGARMPNGADTVVIKERVRVEANIAVIGAGERQGSNVRPRGEEMLAGQLAVGRGQRIRATHASLLASLGMDRVRVFRQPRASIISTGDELVMPGQSCSGAQIYNSNGFGLAALLGGAGAQLDRADESPDGLPFRHVADDREQLRCALLDAARASEVVITSGGVSAGEADHLPGLVRELGQVHFWKVRLRPGMPFLFGEIEGALLFCLPGNPVSSLVTFQSLVRPALRALQGDRELHARCLNARLVAPVRKQHQRTEMLRGSLESGEDGTLNVRVSSRQGSAMISGMLAADVLVEFPESAQTLDAGQVVRVFPIQHD